MEVHPIMLVQKLYTYKFDLDKDYDTFTRAISIEAHNDVTKAAREKRASAWAKELNTANSHELQSDCEFTHEDLMVYNDAFLSFIQNSENGDTGITKPEFGKMLRRVNSNISNHSDEIFELYDEDKSSTIDFRELICCLSILAKGSLR